MIFNIPPICKKPLIFVDENGVLQNANSFCQLNGSYSFNQTPPTQQNGNVRFYKYLSNNQIGQTWGYYKAVNISLYRKIYMKKGYSSGESSLRLYKNLPNSYGEFVLPDYEFFPTSIDGKYVIDEDVRDIAGHYWVLFRCKNTGDEDEHNYYHFYLI